MESVSDGGGPVVNVIPVRIDVNMGDDLGLI